MSASKRKALLTSGVVGCVLIAAARADRAPRLMLNTTTSAPIGFYWITPGRYTVGDLVAVRPPPSLAAWMAARRYLPSNVPLLKVVVAASGQHVCGIDGVLFVDGRRIAQAKSRDHLGRRLPVYSGCGVISDGSVLIVNPAADSLDSRSFGPVPACGVIGRARPIWTWAGRS